MYRKVLTAVGAACLLPSSLFPQQASIAPQASMARNIPPGWVDGSQHPELVPDSAAYRLILLSLRAPAAQSEMARYTAKWKKIGLSPSDTATAQRIVAEFDVQYSAWQAVQQAVRNTVSGAAPKTDAATIVQQAVGALNAQLTPAGDIKFSAFVQAAKARMIVHP